MTFDIFSSPVATYREQSNQIRWVKGNAYATLNSSESPS